MDGHFFGRPHLLAHQKALQRHLPTYLLRYVVFLVLSLSEPLDNIACHPGVKLLLPDRLTGPLLSQTAFLEYLGIVGCLCVPLPRDAPPGPAPPGLVQALVFGHVRPVRCLYPLLLPPNLLIAQLSSLQDCFIYHAAEGLVPAGVQRNLPVRLPVAPTDVRR